MTEVQSPARRQRGGFLRPGGSYAAAALALAVVTAGLISTGSADEAGSAGSLAVLALGVFVISLVLGSSRLVGLVTVPMLGAALIGSAATDGRQWVHSIVIGCLWYAAVELAWESIASREQQHRSLALDQRRAQEIATVVVVSAAMTTVAAALSGLAPQRTLFAQAVVTGGLALVLGLVIRHIVAASGSR